MAGEFAKFYIRLGTLFDPKGLKDAESQIKGTNKAVGGLSAAFTKLGAMFVGGAAIYKLISFAKDSFAAYTKQDDITARLNQALRNQNIYSATLSRTLQGLASDIQKVTTVGDEDTLALIQLGLSMGVTADKMEQATKQAIGLSKAYGVDLNSAMKMVALANQGEYTMLARYIPQLRTLTDETEKAALVNKLLAEGFNLAKIEATTTGGKVKQLENMIGDLKEQIGRFLVPAIDYWADKLKMVVGWLDKLMAVEEKESTASLSQNEKRLMALREQMRVQKEVIDLQNQYAKEIGPQTKGALFDQEKLNKASQLYGAYMRQILDLEKKVADERKKSIVAAKAGKEPAGLIVAGPTEEQLKKDAESRLKNVDGWYLSEKGIAETRFYQWLHDSKIAWDQLDLAQKEETMLRVQDTYARANRTIEGSFLVSIDRMKAAGMGWAQAWDGMWSSTLSGMTANVKTFLTTSGSIFNNFKKLLDGIFKSIASAFIDMVARMIAKWLLLKTITGIFGGGVSMKFIGSFQKGGPIPETGPYLLHKGEEVIPADIANAVRKSKPPTFAPAAMAGSPGANITLNQDINIGGTSETDINVIADKLSEATKNGVISAVNLAKVNYKVGQKREGESSL